MTVNLLRTAVGCDSLAVLSALQTEYRLMTDDNGDKVVALFTRRTPLRANELMDGGSVYWIINRFIQARQGIIDVATVKDSDGRDICRILMEPEIMMVSPLPHRHIQGWRYLDNAKVPSDLAPFDPDNIQSEPDDPAMAEELKELGLI